jgi:hypothetical protein
MMREEQMNLKEKPLQQNEENCTLLLRNHAESLGLLKKQHLEILKKQQENADLDKTAAM